ncbi:Daunorubicin/doxorubicin resistance ATP-binding protein DrrA [Poriferisphaera corsica]|uniref:Daunorubicin/doxorubicin resistance ATP-binding protein DrrA n=1 Tax=Poriferisphaera corsica TaxID=2528020 RepID=A0A517YU04_9BACT|nr:ATP-binding cassette domain-containing protein [Poriferisphaera corsica]QDU33652.1 Daunorubicin/doxorubicin resistance ATP-binding protein DrrA [Poriferisphaera corsica]
MTQPTTNTQSAISVNALSHQYPPTRKSTAPVQALNNVSFAITPGEVFGILGPNGGGKTTLFKILSTILTPSAADAITINNHNLLTNPHLVRQSLGIVFQSPSLDGKLSARENLTTHGHLYGLSGPTLKARVDELLQQFNLADRANDLTESFSGGMKRKIELAKAILHRPQILILDEPSTGLDPAARRDLWLTLHDLIQHHGMTVALTTHLMEEAEKCDRLAILSNGKLVGSGSPSQLKELIGGSVITILPDIHESPQPLLDDLVAQFDGWEDGGAPALIDNTIRCEHAQGPEMVAKISAHLAGRIKSITVGQPTLEDVFVHLTGNKFTN